MSNLITIKCPHPQCEFTEVEDISKLKTSRWKCSSCGTLFNLNVQLPPNRETIAMFPKAGAMEIVLPKDYKGPIPSNEPPTPLPSPAPEIPPSNVTQLPAVPNA